MADNFMSGKYRAFLFTQVWVVVSVLGLPVAGVGQEMRLNSQGQKIIVYSDGSWQLLSSLVMDDTTGTQDNKIPTYSGTIDPMTLPGMQLTQADAFKIATRRSQLAASAALISQKRLEEITKEKKRLEEELKTILDSDARLDMEKRLLQQRTLELQATAESELAAAEATRAKDLSTRSDVLSALAPMLKEPETFSPETETSANQFYIKAGFLNSAVEPQSIVSMPLFSPPVRTCQLAYEGKDESTRMYRKDTQKESFFMYTDEKLRLFLKDKPYLETNAYMISLGGYRLLSMEYIFSYADARQAYGTLAKNSLLTIKFLNGGFVTLRAANADTGQYDDKTEQLTYRVQYYIDRAQMNLLKKQEIESVLVFWETGYEEYPVYNVDFFIDHSRCLEN